MSETFTQDLTVATVCRNALATLPRCIESVRGLLNHPMLKVEHLLVDGNSTDGTLEYLQQELKVGHISRFISEPDKGLYDAMNKAIRLAQGRIIVFINADDEICPEAVFACCEPILRGKAKYVVADTLCISGNKKNMFHPCMKRTLWRQPYCHQSMYCATELLRQFQGFQWERFRIGADTELMRRLYINDIPYKVVRGTASRFYDGGVSSTADVVRERYELMLHFESAYKKEVTTHPTRTLAIIKHLRRYAARKILQETNGQQKKEDMQRIADFIQSVCNSLPPIVKMALKLLLQAQKRSYACTRLLKKGNKRILCMLQEEITGVFMEQL